jgi:eukaryotic-like serine/threonine-protein kinase
LKEQKPADALDLLRAAAPYDLGTPLCSAPAYFGMLYPVYVRGLAYLAAHRADEAATEFQKVVDHRTVVVSDPIGALARMQLGRAFAMAGKSAKARSSYQEFLALWKTADPDLPLPAQARMELAALR